MMLSQDVGQVAVERAAVVRVRRVQLHVVVHVVVVVVELLRERDN